MSSVLVTSGQDEQVEHELIDDDEGGLFGDGDEDGASGVESISSTHRKLSDEELDSGDDEGRTDRIDYEAEKAAKEPELANILAASIGRHAGPQPSDNELYLLHLPNSIGIEPKNFTLGSFQPPQTDHHSSGPPSATFSAFQTSTNTIRWRHSPSEPNHIQSNARVLRWSDGSLTLQLATNPCEQLELVAKPLAQPQINPKKPTPTSVTSRTQGPAPYDPRLESHTYLMAPHESAELMRTTNRITAYLAIQSSSDQDDEALARLQQSLAAAQKGNKGTVDGGLTVININEDPELAKKRAELAEKEKSKMARRMQVQQERESTRSNTVLKRSGLRTGGMGGGLTIGGLEDDEGMAATRGRVSKPKSRRPRRRNSEYSDDEEDFRGRGRTREDEYDEEDGFLVGSDEEVEVGEESEEEAEMGDDVDEEEPAEKSKKRESEEAAGGARTKRRRVIDDEDED
ncbi:RNA polymerase-associated protein LEO1, partial [Lecanoromycetidae sp. Uapishka_2]